MEGVGIVEGPLLFYRFTMVSSWRTLESRKNSHARPEVVPRAVVNGENEVLEM